MAKIAKIKGRQVFDSRGNPTIQTEVYLDDGSEASAIVPSGASKGTHEAFELRDIENKKFLGKSVLGALKKINGEISKTLVGQVAEDQRGGEWVYLVPGFGIRFSNNLILDVEYPWTIYYNVNESQLIPDGFLRLNLFYDWAL